MLIDRWLFYVRGKTSFEFIPGGVFLGLDSPVEPPADRNAPPSAIEYVGLNAGQWLQLPNGDVQVTLGGCDVLSFPFDWRRTPAASVDALRRLVLGQFQQTGRKLHLVGHSMGGLVARDFCLRYPDDASRAVAQIIQLGTPNYGSCESIRNLTVGGASQFGLQALSTPVARATTPTDGADAAVCLGSRFAMARQLKGRLPGIQPCLRH